MFSLLMVISVLQIDFLTFPRQEYFFIIRVINFMSQSLEYVRLGIYSDGGLLIINSTLSLWIPTLPFESHTVRILIYNQSFIYSQQAMFSNQPRYLLIINLMLTTIQLNNDLLRQYVDAIFDRYDLDRSNTLTLNQLVVFFNDLLGSRGEQQKMSMWQVQQSLKAMDTNSDGQITKTELYNALKKMNIQSGLLGISNQSQVSQVPALINNNFVKYPTFSNVTVPQVTIQKPAVLTNPINLFAKPQVATNFINSHVASQVSSNKIISQTPSFTLQKQVRTQPVYFSAPKYPTKRIHTHEVIQPIIVPPAQGFYGPSVYGPPPFGPPPFYAGPPPMMGFGPMGMGMGPMGMMGPRFGPMGMGPFGMNPFSALVGGLFGVF